MKEIFIYVVDVSTIIYKWQEHYIEQFNYERQEV